MTPRPRFAAYFMTEKETQMSNDKTPYEKAIQTLVELLSSSDPSIRFAAAQALLGRVAEKT